MGVRLIPWARQREGAAAAAVVEVADAVRGPFTAAVVPMSSRPLSPWRTSSCGGGTAWQSGATTQVSCSSGERREAAGKAGTARHEGDGSDAVGEQGRPWHGASCSEKKGRERRHERELREDTGEREGRKKALPDSLLRQGFYRAGGAEEAGASRAVQGRGGASSGGCGVSAGRGAWERRPGSRAEGGGWLLR